MPFLTWMDPRRASASVIVLTLMTGCSSGLPTGSIQPALVRGVVAINGRPLTRGTVTFLPVNATSERIDPGIARIEPDGSYWIGNANLSKPAGLRPGRYKVTVLAMKPMPEGPEGPIATLEVPARYTDEQTTPFDVTVQVGQNRIRLDLVSDSSADASANASAGAGPTPVSR